jgi:ribonuclease VapC
LLAIFFGEALSQWASERLLENSSDLQMSTVNYVETLMLVGDRFPRRLEEVRELIDSSEIQIVPPTRQQGEIAARARLRFPLNMGDCFAYALAKEQDCPLLTLDRDFRNTDISVVLPKRVS